MSIQPLRTRTPKFPHPACTLTPARARAHTHTHTHTGELNRDYDEEALSHQCTTALQRERREIFIDRWQKISAEEKFERGRLCPDAELWLCQWRPRIGEYVPSSAAALKKLKDQLLNLLPSRADDTDSAAGIIDDSWRTEPKPAAVAPTTPVRQSDVHGSGVAGLESPLTPMTALKKRTEAYLAGAVNAIHLCQMLSMRFRVCCVEGLLQATDLSPFCIESGRRRALP